MTIDLSQVVYAIGRTGAEGVTLLGTCFAVAPDKVGTAFHVAGADEKGVVLILPKVKCIADYQDTSDMSLTVVPLALTAADPIRDLSIFSLPSDHAITFSYAIAGTDLVPTGAPVVTLGFRTQTWAGWYSPNSKLTSVRGF